MKRKRMKIIAGTFLVSAMMLGMAGSAWAIEFSDVPQSHWAHQYITELSEKGVINGYTDGTYQPENSVTRGEYLKLILTALEGEEYFKDKDVAGKHWAYKYMEEATDKNYCPYSQRGDSLDANITRVEMARILAKICKFNGIENSSPKETISYTDLKDTSVYDKNYIQLVSKNGLLNGYTDGSFQPGRQMTRAEVATIIYRFLNLKG